MIACARGLNPPAIKRKICPRSILGKQEARNRVLHKKRAAQASKAAQVSYENIKLENPPTVASEITSLSVTSWRRFARDLHDGRIEQICILSDVERVKCEAVELKQLITEDEDALSAKSKKERFDEQIWDSLKSSLFYDVLRKYTDLLPDDTPVELPQDKGKCGQVWESKSPHSAPPFCVKKAQGVWRIVHTYIKLNDATAPAQTPIPRKDVITDSMALSTIFSALDLRDGFYQILMLESDIPLTAVSTPIGMLWEWLVMRLELKNAPATFNSRAVNGNSEVEMQKEHLRKLFALMRT
ncbi:hypothetical protein PR001_g1127 [Phytophthora rubi]|uniref:Reverse transcriptase domain-containing protein n=2 Tax=Phytophthora rubi TaxID=129364 RepID=A0A6A3P1D8_9STRA|nr:hypothetical protein PR001_g1127 [Phytophthora rubi]